MKRAAAIGFAMLFGSTAQGADLPADYGDAAPLDAAANQQTGVAMSTYAACRQAIADWAEPFAPLDIETVSVGPVQRHLNGTRVAPLYVRIVYETSAGRQTRKANVECTVDASDTVAVEPIN